MLLTSTLLPDLLCFPGLEDGVVCILCVLIWQEGDVECPQQLWRSEKRERKENFIIGENLLTVLKWWTVVRIVFCIFRKNKKSKNPCPLSTRSWRDIIKTKYFVVNTEKTMSLISCRTPFRITQGLPFAETMPQKSSRSKVCYYWNKFLTPKWFLHSAKCSNDPDSSSKFP